MRFFSIPVAATCYQILQKFAVRCVGNLTMWCTEVREYRCQAPLRGTVLADKLRGVLPAIALDGHPALTTAYMNDAEPLLTFAQQVNGYGKEEDTFLGISTSGNSKNVLYAATVAKAKGLHVVGLTGQKDSKLKDVADVTIQVPQTETYMIQELHLPVYHCLCLMLEDRFFEK